MKCLEQARAQAVVRCVCGVCEEGGRNGTRSLRTMLCWDSSEAASVWRIGANERLCVSSVFYISCVR